LSEDEPKIKLSTRILKAVSLFLMGVFMILLFIGFYFQPINFNLIITGFIGLFASSLIRTLAGTGIIEPKFTTLKEIQCNNLKCEVHKYQEFEIGDYVHKILDKCKKCNKGNITIKNIFQLKEEEAKNLLDGKVEK
jgi:hypothetical protein